MSNKSSKGLLIMASNSLGLEADIPTRSLEAVKEAALLVFEEDKPARMVLKNAGVHRDYLKYNEQDQKETLTAVRDTLTAGKTVVYMSDQGCPTLEDPGFEVARTARRCNAQIKVIPGPSSLTAALSACPFSNKTFEFLGFPPREEGKRKQFFTKMFGKEKLQIFMDTPYRLKRVIESCIEVFPESVKGYIALDISGEDEDYLFGTFGELLEEVNKIDKKLNFVMIINPVNTLKKNSGKSSNNRQDHPRRKNRRR